MRQSNRQPLLRWALAVVALSCAIGARAQVTFDGMDWLTDRGNISPFLAQPVLGNWPDPLRLGYNEFFSFGAAPDHAQLNPGTASPRFVWPFTRDIAQYDTNGDPFLSVTVDNQDLTGLDPLDPQNMGIALGPAAAPARVEPQPLTTPPLTPPAGITYPAPNAQAYPQSRLIAPAGNPWVLPLIANRAPGLGFSFGFDPTQNYNFDYYNVLERQGTFTVNRGGGSTPVTDAEFAALPNIAPDAYAAIHTALVADTTAGNPSSVWTSGGLQIVNAALPAPQYPTAPYNMVPGRYGIDIYSPGDGTLDVAGNAHPNVRRALVRVSWKSTVNPDGSLNYGTGVANAGGINDPQNSRIFVVDLGQQGWIHLSGGGLGVASFPYVGDVQSPLTVTLYTISPDSPTDPQYGTAPLVTADAVRFVRQLVPTYDHTVSPPKLVNPPLPLTKYNLVADPGMTNPLWTISGMGTILSATAGTAKLPTGKVVPASFVARSEAILEQDLANPPLRSYLDPTNPASGPTADPTALSFSPVFYCIDNQNGDTTLPTGGAPPTRNIYSVEKVIWRYVGVPDTSSAIQAVTATGGLSTASPLLANVRARNGLVLPIVYFFTTSPDGGTGHVYALNPNGTPADPAAGTVAYWIYPSYRPNIGTEPAGAPLQYQDPNYTLPTGDTRTGYPLPAYGADQPFPDPYFDGDIIIQNGARAVRPDTIVRTAGISGSPVLMDDPSNPPALPTFANAQILVVPMSNGRIMALDAGGRGDFGLTTTGAVAAGTTQRYWTWPHIGADTFHARGNINPAQGDTANGWNEANPFSDDKSAVSFTSSLAFQPGGGSFGIVLAGAGDGHLYGILPRHDVRTATFPGISYASRLSIQYPDSNSTLGAGVSTPAIFNNNAYFTANGRVWSVSAVPGLGPPPTIATLNWAYPSVASTPPAAPLAPGLNGTAPMVIAGANIAAGQPDSVYVSQGNGNVLDINAATGALIATGTSLVGGNIRTSPIGTLMTSQIFLDPTNAAQIDQPMAVIADDDGTMSAFGLVPINDGTGNMILPILNTITDSASPRSASFALVGGDTYDGVSADDSSATDSQTPGSLNAANPPHGMLYEGDTNGQLRAYGIGAANGAVGSPLTYGGSTTGPGEPPITGFGANGMVTVDLRNVDFYQQADYQNMAQPTRVTGVTPAKTTTGANYTNTVQPLTTGLPGNAVDVDWGDYLYIAASGVYHAVPQNAANTYYGAAPPIVQVTFTVTQSGSSSASYTFTVPALTNPRSPTDATGWPDDAALTDAEANGVTIMGIDPNDTVNTGVQALTTNAKGVYPWVAKFRVHIRPDARRPYVPGATAYEVTATAQVRQQITGPGGTNTARNQALAMRAGRSYWPGKSANPFGPNPNRATDYTGSIRPVYVTNPIALSVRGSAGLGAGASFLNVIGWGGAASTFGTAGTDPGINEILANDNSLTNNLLPSTEPFKQLFAPVGMIQDGSSQIFTGLDNTNNPAPALYVMDRSNLRQTTGAALEVAVATDALHWFGGASSVMNPLPWDSLPTDAQDTRDYPNLPTTSLSVVNKATGVSMLNNPAPLLPPNYPDALAADRVPVPTEVDLTVTVPRYQAANVNRARVTSGSSTFGSDFVDLNGNVNNNQYAHGPLQLTSGSPVPVTDPHAFPAGGYLGRLYVYAVTPGVRTQPPFTTNAGSGPGQVNLANLNTAQVAYRQLTAGVTVPPRIAMRVAESTVDVGKLPQGEGFSDKNPNGPPWYMVPFMPSMPPSPSSPGGIVSYFDSSLQTFFQPFTLISESNVNLVDLRVANLIGAPGSAISAASLSINPPAGTAAAARLQSDQVSGLSGIYLFGLPFEDPTTPAEGNIGFVSSFDHNSTNSMPGNYQYRANPLWPLSNQFVTAAGIANAGLPTSGLIAWADGVEPLPTLHKPRVGDVSGTTATVPDTPHDANAYILASGQSAPTLLPPKIGVAVPLGTPSGTYSAPVYPFEDNTPIQWREWLGTSAGNGGLTADHDGILNVNAANTPTEGRADPTFTLKATVIEARLTNSYTNGTLPEIDWQLNPLVPPAAPGAGPAGPTPASNLLPAVIRPVIAGSPGNVPTVLYWTQANRDPATGYLLGGSTVNTTAADQPYTLAYSTLAGPGPNEDFAFASATGNAGNPLTFGHWWTAPTLFPPLTAGSLANLFPSNAAEATAGAVAGIAPPFLAGTRSPQTARFASPAAALETSAAGDSAAGWLFWQGQIDKVNGGNGQAAQTTDSRTFYMPLAAGVPNLANPPNSMLNDPARTKLSPRPLVVNIGANKYSYLFWFAGGQGHTQLYFNYSPDPNLAMNTWSNDTVLPVPTALAWASDPVPIYRQVPVNGQLTDCVDVVFTGVIRNRRVVESLLARYAINEGQFAGQPTGMLVPVTLPAVQDETATPVGGQTNTWQTRDAAWVVHSTVPGAGNADLIAVWVIHPDGTVIQVNQASPGVNQRGTLDTSSGLVFYNSLLGGQLAVDPNSGTVSFPNVAPGRNDQVVVSYVPQLMRLNVTRDDSNVQRAALSAPLLAEPALKSRPGITVAGNNMTPIALLDRGPNPVTASTSPALVFTAANTVAATAPPVDRYWVLYRKSDPSGGTKSSIYYKTMRLMVRLPYPCALTVPNNGMQQLVGVTVTGAAGPYEVDWVRGRLYFTEADEGSSITVTYTSVNGVYTALPYTVGWGDEISAAGSAYDPTKPFGPGNPFQDLTTPEVLMPADSAVNEGQMAAIKDPLVDKVWVFWASTRAGSTDLFYQTISPPFYPLTSGTLTP